VLTPKQHAEVESHVEEGDEFLDAGNFDKALEKYHQAAALIPEPKTDDESALSVFTAMGEALFHSGRYAEAISAFQTAAKAPGGIENPLVHLRLGEAYFELGDLDRAADELMRAYMLDGKEILEGPEERKYFEFLKTRADLE